MKQYQNRSSSWGLALLVIVVLLIALYAWPDISSRSLSSSNNENGSGLVHLGLTADDCFEDEIFDAETGSCYIDFECEDEESCNEAEDDYFGFIEELGENYFSGESVYTDIPTQQARGQREDNHSHDREEHPRGLTEEEREIVTYRVSGSSIESPNRPFVPEAYKELQDNEEAHSEIWGYVIEIIPSGYLSYITSFTLYTDDFDGSVAGIYQDNQIDKWVIAIDILDAYPDDEFDKEELAYSLVHEFGHLVTLNDTQVIPDIETFAQGVEAVDATQMIKKEEDCMPNYFTGEGCSKSMSYINLFFNEYWSRLWDEYLEINSIEDDNLYYEELDKFATFYHDRFITSYAATNPGEDIAESFTAFVLKDQPDERNTVANQKVKFFYRFPELVQLRDHIRNRL